MQRPTSFPRAILTICLVVAIALLAEWTALAEADRPGEFLSGARSQSSESLPPLPRPIFLYAGSCDDLGDIQWPLNYLMSPGGEEGGSSDSDRTEYSFTANVPLTIDLMLEGDFAINVHESNENLDNLIACGNIGGVADAVGQLVVGLREEGGSDVTGIVVMSPSPAVSTMTYVSAFITGVGLGDEIGTIGSAAPSADSSNPPVVVDPPPADDPPPSTDPPPVVYPPSGDDDDDGDDDDSDDAGSDDD